MKAEDNLSYYLTEADKLSHDVPQQLSRKIYILTQALGLIGKFHADAVRAAGLAEAERKKVYSEAIVSATGTATDKQAKAEISCHDARRKEAEANGEMWRWRNAYSSQVEAINALKLELRSLIQEYNDSNTTG